MVKTTRAQRVALKRVFDRRTIYGVTMDGRVTDHPLTYRQFRRQVHPSVGCIMVKWAGMWLGIEPDGYTHS